LDNVRGSVSGIDGGFHWRSPAAPSGGSLPYCKVFPSENQARSFLKT
jgi:hypothetical protein